MAGGTVDLSLEDPFNAVLGAQQQHELEIAAGAGEQLRLDYTSLTPADPLVSIDDWTIDRHTGTKTKVSASGWETKPSTSSGSMHADAAILDLNSQAVYVGVENITVPDDAQMVALMVIKGYAPAAWSPAGFLQTPGYLCVVRKNSVIVSGFDASGSYANSGSFGDPMPGSTLSKLEMRVTIGGASNVIQIFVDDIQLGSDWVDSHADRITGADVFNTFGCAISHWVGAAIVEQVYGGTL